MKHKQESRKVAAVLLITYILFGSVYLYDNYQKNQHMIRISGLVTTGHVYINILSKCNFDLNPEYNLFSICANVTNTSISKVLESITGQYSFVLRWNDTAQNFDIFSPEAAENPFNKFELNQSYFIFMNNGATLNIGGNEHDHMDVSLIEEYNAPAYPFIFSANVSSYIKPIKENVSFVLKWNKTNQLFNVYSPEAINQEFEKLDVGDGQFVIMIEKGVLRYNKTALQP